VRQSAHPLPEVESSGGHEQDDGVPEHSFQVISRRAVIMFDMSDHRLNPGSSAEAFSRLTAQGRCVSLSRWARCQNFCVANPGATPIARVADVHLGTGFRDLPCLLQHFGQRIAVMDVFREGQRSEEDASGLGDYTGSLSVDLVFLVFLVLADAQDVGFLQTVTIVLSFRLCS